MQLSPHFALGEFTRSQAARNRGLSNEPGSAHLANLSALAQFLEEIRALVGRTVIITSGYRSPAVNAAVGGVENSAHALGHAVDIRVHGISALDLARRIRDSGLRFDQLILETGRGVVHLSRDPRLRQQVLRQPNGPGTRVFPGLE
jgi:zinc D-Ala-D-Ala carboxypeptidase